MNTSRLVQIGSILLTTGCGAGGESVPAIPVERSDSVGVPVYSLPQRLPPWDDPDFAWTLELERSIRTGTASAVEEPLLFEPQAYARLGDGRLVVLDAGADRLAVISAGEDAVLARFGPTGQGPGEIWSSNSMIWPGPGDDIQVLDPGNRRLSRFTLDGGLEEERQVDIGGMGGVGFQRVDTHEPLFWKVFLGDPEVGELTDSVGRFDVEAGLVEFIAPMPPRVEARRSNRGSPALFDPMGWFAPVGDGVVVGRNDRARFRHYADSGALLAIIEVPMEPAPIPETDHPEILEEFYGVAQGSAPREVAESYPLFNLMWPLDDSLFALQQSHRSTPRGEPRIPTGRMVWRVLSTHGSYAGAIILPEGVAQPYWIEEDRLIATYRDSLGIATIRSYRLIPHT